uniref:Uncharacterized protein n=1 Tax=Cacopsylla melanoneura TaxID=428564 RepID=A0A8D8XV98_9HEMI
MLVKSLLRVRIVMSFTAMIIIVARLGTKIRLLLLLCLPEQRWERIIPQCWERIVPLERIRLRRVLYRQLGRLRVWSILFSTGTGTVLLVSLTPIRPRTIRSNRVVTMILI